MFHRTYGLTREEEKLVRKHTCDPPTWSLPKRHGGSGTKWASHEHNHGHKPWYCPDCGRKWVAPNVTWKLPLHQSRADQRRRMMRTKQNNGANADVMELHNELVARIEREGSCFEEHGD